MHHDIQQFVGSELLVVFFVGFGKVELEIGEHPNGFVNFSPAFSDGDKDTSLFKDFQG